MSKIFVILAVILHASLCQAMYDWKTKTFIRKDNSKLVVPGTKWCGKGNNAMSFNDLGEFVLFTPSSVVRDLDSIFFILLLVLISTIPFQRVANLYFIMTFH